MRRQNAARIPALLYHGDALILIRCFFVVIPAPE